MSLADISLTKIDAVYSHVRCSQQVAYEIQDWFSFYIPNAEYVAKAKGLPNWDGKIKLFRVRDRLIYNGLVPELVERAEQAGYEVDDARLAFHLAYDNPFDDAWMDEQIAALNLQFSLYDHQRNAVRHCLKNQIGLILSPTSSGKSLIMYVLQKLQAAYVGKPQKVLILVPKKSLVLQLQKDFISYGGDPEDTQIIMGGMSRKVEKDVVISTWQSATKMDKEWLNQFDMVFGDEAHNYDSKVLSKALDEMKDVWWRFGFTGTTDGTKTHVMKLQAAFGPVVQFITTKEMIDAGLAPKVTVHIVIFQYPESVLKRAKKFQYLDEVDFIQSHEERNRFIVRLADMKERNSLVLFDKVEFFGEPLYQLAQERAKNKRPRFIHGGIDVKVRERMRDEVEATNDNMILATYGVFQEGVNIKNLSTLILASSTKSMIRLLQSIGRLLRLHDEIDSVTIYDLADDLTTGPDPCASMAHLDERLMIYNQSGFKYEFHYVKLY